MKYFKNPFAGYGQSIEMDESIMVIRRFEILCLIILILPFVFSFRADAGEVMDIISVGKGPMQIAITPNGDYAYVTNQNDHTVSVIRTSDNVVIITIS
ncbi:MAG: hypothetical protein PVG41_11215, partial [Desulfobacteraceae bacterium]